MPDWNAEAYLKFENQRTQPAIDLAQRIAKYRPLKAADLGCGPGNSTAVLRNIFPEAQLVGLDYSENMIKKAMECHSDIKFELCDAQSLKGEYDLIFSNACLQWIPHHDALLPYLMSKLKDNGALAV